MKRRSSRQNLPRSWNSTMRVAPFVDANSNPPLPRHRRPGDSDAAAAAAHARLDFVAPGRRRHSDASRRRKRCRSQRPVPRTWMPSRSAPTQRRRGPATCSNGVFELAVQTFGELAMVDGIARGCPDRSGASGRPPCSAAARAAACVRGPLRQAAELRERARAAAPSAASRSDAALVRGRGRARAQGRPPRGRRRRGEGGGGDQAAGSSRARRRTSSPRRSRAPRAPSRPPPPRLPRCARSASSTATTKAMAKKLPKKLTPLQSAAKSANGRSSRSTRELANRCSSCSTPRTRWRSCPRVKST